MAEKIISPGVFIQENDQSYLPAGFGAGSSAAIIGPTVKGPAMVPTKINSYRQFATLFGDIVDSGSGQYQYLTSHAAQEYLKHGGSLIITRILSGSFSPASASVMQSDGTGSAFTLYTLGDGAIYNNSGSIGTNNLLSEGSDNNYRWEVTNVDDSKGTFNLVIRRGNDTSKRKIVLETWTNLSLDPSSNNYIKRVIGDQKPTYVYNSGDPYIEMSGGYENKSSYVRVDDVTDLLHYLDDNGEVRDGSLSSSLPPIGSGSIGGAFTGGSDGEISHPQNFYNDITETNSQGFDPTACTEYEMAINLLGNKDEYDINMLLMPGISYDVHSTTANNAVQMCENRADCIYIMDPAIYNSTISTATDASAIDSSYAAAYWPWIQIQDILTNQYRWVPSSTVMGGVIAFNDKVSYEWYAPAGLNRGGIESAIRAERKLTHSNRDTLYQKSINPLATFPGQGVSAWGQKTLQKKASALDRINVRRLLITAKKYIAARARSLTFEQNTSSTRTKFLNMVNPYLENIQANKGLYLFKVVMDESNNTSDVIDRNKLVGEIYLQPAKSAEFISIDFNITPTGVEFSG